MIRVIAVMVSLLLAGALAVQLGAETRYRMLSSRTVGELLDPSGESKPQLVYVFQAEDCVGEGDMLKRWNQVRRDAGFVVRGVVVGDGGLSARQRELFGELEISIPVAGIRRNTAEAVAERLGFTHTPFAVLLDDQLRVIASFPAAEQVRAEVLEGLLDRTADGSELPQARALARPSPRG